MNRTQRKMVAAAVAGMVASVGTTALQAAETLTLEQLDQKVRILERKLEIADEAATAKAKETPATAAGKDGFSLSSADKSFQLKLRGYLQTDARFFPDDSEQKAVDTFAVRRARVIVEGTLARQFEFRVAPDFGGGKSELQDCFLDYKPAAVFNLRFGRTKIPLGMERLQSTSETFFNEAGPATALTPNYDIGVMPYGSVGKGILEYSLGVFNGAPDGASGDADSNDGKDFAARLMVNPFKNTDIAALKGLSFGVAGTIGEQEGNTTTPGLPSIRSAGQQTIFSYKTSTNLASVAYANGDRTHLAPQLYYTVGAVGLMGEYVIADQEVANGKGSDTVRMDAWQATATCVLTGESPSLKGVNPLRPFNPGSGQWGAVELAARAGELSVDDAAFKAGFADTKKSVSNARTAGVGVNWYVSRNVKFVLDYDRTTFTGGDASGDRPDENVVSARAQVAW